jgi:hypothetical protein
MTNFMLQPPYLGDKDSGLLDTKPLSHSAHGGDDKYPNLASN